MTSAREIMEPIRGWVGEDDTLVEAMRLMTELGVDVVPICGDDGYLRGMVTMQAIQRRCIDAGRDPRRMRACAFAGRAPVSVRADDEIDSVRAIMQEHALRVVPVIDARRLVGTISDQRASLRSTGTRATTSPSSAEPAPPATMSPMVSWYAT